MSSSLTFMTITPGICLVGFMLFGWSGMLWGMSIWCGTAALTAAARRMRQRGSKWREVELSEIAFRCRADPSRQVDDDRVPGRRIRRFANVAVVGPVDLRNRQRPLLRGDRSTLHTHRFGGTTRDQPRATAQTPSLDALMSVRQVAGKGNETLARPAPPGRRRTLH
jgi:hypothetical protein